MSITLKNIQRTTVLLAIIVLAGLLLRVYVANNAVTISKDATDYVMLAQAFAEGNFSEGMHTARAPLYPAISGLVSLVTGDTELALRTVAVLFGTLSILAIFFLTKLIYNERVGVIAALFTALHPRMVRYSADTLTEGLFYFLVSLTLFIAVKTMKKRTTMTMVYLGIAAALAYLTKSSAVLLFMLISTWIILWDFKSLRQDWKIKLYHLTIAWAVFIALAMPYILFIKRATGTAGLTGKVSAAGLIGKLSTITDNIYVFIQNVPEAIGWALVPFFIFWIVTRKKQGLLREEVFLSSIIIVYWLLFINVGPVKRWLVQLMPLTLPLIATGFCHAQDLIVEQKKKFSATISIGLLLLVIVVQIPKYSIKLHSGHYPEKQAGVWSKEVFGSEVKVLTADHIFAYYAGAEQIFLSTGIKSLDEELEDARNNNISILAGYDSRLKVWFPMLDKRGLEVLKKVEAKKGKTYTLYKITD